MNFHGRARENYINWKSEVEVWRLVTDLAEKKPGIGHSSLSRKQAKVIALEIDIKEINKRMVWKHWYKHWTITDDVDLGYTTYFEFDSYRYTSSGMLMNEFIIEDTMCVKSTRWNSLMQCFLLNSLTVQTCLREIVGWCFCVWFEIWNNGVSIKTHFWWFMSFRGYYRNFCETKICLLHQVLETWWTIWRQLTLPRHVAEIQH